MKKRLMICMALLTVLALLGGNALAASTVRYEGGAEKFVFLPGSEYSSSDLFENFKDVLPGDVITQKISVRNNSGGVVRIYMRAETEGMEDADFLSQLSMTVECRDEEIFNAAPSETAQLTQNTLLGAFTMNGSTTLTVTLTVPETLGNEYMGRIGVVPWVFIAEEIPEDDTPDTGDWFRIQIWISVAAGLAILLILLMLLRNRRKAQN